MNFMCGNRSSGMVRKRSRRDVQVHTINASAVRGFVRLGSMTLECAIGRSGQRWRKREGDGASPAGAWKTEGVLYRADRVRRPVTRLPVRQIRPADGWCDAPADRNYNRRIQFPYPASHERLWRKDGLYDIVVVLAHNRRPRVRRAGSAIFVHLARPGFTPTEGCLAVSPSALRKLLALLSPGDRVVWPGPAGGRFAPVLGR